MKRPSRDWYDLVSLGVGIVGVIGVVATIAIGRFDQKSNGKDVHDAIGRMADIATAMQKQKPLLEKQAKAAADSAAAAKTTADLAKGQTDAVVQQAHSLMAGAQATIKAAEAQLAAAQANIKTAQNGAKAAQANMDAAERQRQSAELFASTRAPASTLSSVSIDGWADAPDKVGVKKLRVKPMFTNTGGGTLFPGFTSFNLVITTAVPEKRPAVDQTGFGGNENPISSGEQYVPVKAFDYYFPKSEIDAVNGKTKSIVVWGTTLFTDGAQRLYTKCFIAVVQPPSEGAPSGSVRTLRVPGYRC
jgi:hypothetical protein